MIIEDKFKKCEWKCSLSVFIPVLAGGTEESHEILVSINVWRTEPLSLPPQIWSSFANELQVPSQGDHYSFLGCVSPLPGYMQCGLQRVTVWPQLATQHTPWRRRSNLYHYISDFFRNHWYLNTVHFTRCNKATSLICLHKLLFKTLSSRLIFSEECAQMLLSR
jgi:hypothetical protein